MLLGVRAVIAESYERIHRSNLVGMGVLPLQFLPGESATSLGPDRPRGVHDPRARRGPDAAPAVTVVATPIRPTAARSAVQRDRPARRPDRGRLLPERRDPAGGPATDRRVERERVGFLNDGDRAVGSMSSAVGRTDGLPEEPTTDTTTDSEPAPDLAAAPSDLTTRSTRHLRDDLIEAVGRAVVGADEAVRLVLWRCSPTATSWSRTSRAPARRSSPGRSPGRSTSDERGSRARPTCCRSTSPGPACTRAARCGSSRARSSRTSCSSTRSTGRRRGRSRRCSRRCRSARSRSRATTRPLPEPFVVLATQNPIEYEGTFALPAGPARPVPRPGRGSAIPTRPGSGRSRAATRPPPSRSTRSSRSSTARAARPARPGPHVRVADEVEA